MWERICLHDPLPDYARVSVFVSRLTSNVYLTASEFNAPSSSSVSGCFQWPRRAAPEF